MIFTKIRAAYSFKKKLKKQGFKVTVNRRGNTFKIGFTGSGVMV